MNNLFSFTRNKIPCDLQGFADDLILTASGFDADTLRDVTQRSLTLLRNGVLTMISLSGISTDKTHSVNVMLTRKLKWKLARPLALVVHGKDLKLLESTKFLGIILDQKLTTNVDSSHRETNQKKPKVY